MNAPELYSSKESHPERMSRLISLQESLARDYVMDISDIEGLIFCPECDGRGYKIISMMGGKVLSIVDLYDPAAEIDRQIEIACHECEGSKFMFGAKQGLLRPRNLIEISNYCKERYPDTVNAVQEMRAIISQMSEELEGEYDR